MFSCHPLLCLQRAPHSFQSKMKLEAVDKRSPGLIRVATVEEVETHRIKVIICMCLCVINIELVNVWGSEGDGLVRINMFLQLFLPLMALKLEYVLTYSDILMYIFTNQPQTQVELYCASIASSLFFISLLFQVHYDGWSHVYDEWMDSDHPDIHPAGWCEATGHPLKVPPRDPKTQQPHGNNPQHMSLCLTSQLFPTCKPNYS